MTVETRLENNDSRLVITISGRFDFTVANGFLNSYRHDQVKSEYVLDLADVSFMDSAAIGMILLLHEFTENKSVIRLVNCGPALMKTVQLSHLDRFVEIAA